MSSTTRAAAVPLSVSAHSPVKRLFFDVLNRQVGRLLQLSEIVLPRKIALRRLVERYEVATMSEWVSGERSGRVSILKMH
jgi:hypothetical protein